MELNPFSLYSHYNLILFRIYNQPFYRYRKQLILFIPSDIIPHLTCIYRSITAKSRSIPYSDKINTVNELKFILMLTFMNGHLVRYLLLGSRHFRLYFLTLKKNRESPPGPVQSSYFDMNNRRNNRFGLPTSLSVGRVFS